MQPSGFGVWVVDFSDWHGGPYVYGVYAEKTRAIKEGVPAAFLRNFRNHGGGCKFEQTHRVVPERFDVLYFEGTDNDGRATVRHYVIR